MCGLAGYYCADGINKNILLDMTKSLSHRGPDDEGVWQNNIVGLAHTRLSILDLSSNGHQPMVSSSGRYIIVFNGEIYNHLKIRKKINTHWNSHSDTETILENIENFGIEKTLSEMEGMFSFVIYDKVNNHLILARDPIGQKPLYYGWVENKFIFASELKAFKTIQGKNFQIDRNSLAVYMKTGYIPAPATIYKNIYKLKPGTFANLDLKGSKNFKQKSYYSINEIILNNNQLRDNDFESSKSELKNTLLKSVEKQQISDVPIGSFLSGGIDSSLITCLMQEVNKNKINTFTIGFDDKRFDESSYAKRIADTIGTNHNELIVKPNDILNVIPLIPKIYDEPFSDSSQLVTYLLSSFARESVTVALSGDGGDELFCGYNRYLWASRILSIPYFLRAFLSYLLKNSSVNIFSKIEELTIYLGLIGSNYQFSDKLVKLSYLIGNKDLDILYKNLLANYIDDSKSINDLVVGSPASINILNFEIPNHLNNTEKMMYCDTLSYLPDDILCKVDRASMAVGLETRAPFLEKEVIELSWNLPKSYKINKGKSKYILRSILEDYLPYDFINRPKMGFAIPLSSWLRGPLKDMAESKIEMAINSSDCFFNKEIVIQKWNEHKSKKRNWHYFIWNLIVFQTWLEYNM